MSPDPTPHRQLLATLPAHCGAAILAAIGALVLQAAWPAILRREPGASWWPVDACVLVSATGYLVSTVWLHVRATKWRFEERGPWLWRFGRGLVSDLAIVLLAGMLFANGPETSVLRSGLWIVLPTLLAASLASAGVTGSALLVSYRNSAHETTPASMVRSGVPSRALEMLRTLLVVLLVVALYTLENVEPQAKPWETTPSTRVGKTAED